MRRILLTVAACALGLTLTSTVEAHPPRHAPAHVYYRDHGVRFSGGYYFAGRNHHHWSYKVWDARCRCYHYYDPVPTLPQEGQEYWRAFARATNGRQEGA